MAETRGGARPLSTFCELENRIRAVSLSIEDLFVNQATHQQNLLYLRSQQDPFCMDVLGGKVLFTCEPGHDPSVLSSRLSQFCS